MTIDIEYYDVIGGDVTVNETVTVSDMDEVREFMNDIPEGWATWWPFGIRINPR